MNRFLRWLTSYGDPPPRVSLRTTNPPYVMGGLVPNEVVTRYEPPLPGERVVTATNTIWVVVCFSGDKSPTGNWRLDQPFFTEADAKRHAEERQAEHGWIWRAVRCYGDIRAVAAEIEADLKQRGLMPW